MILKVGTTIDWFFISAPFLLLGIRFFLWKWMIVGDDPIFIVIKMYGNALTLYSYISLELTMIVTSYTIWHVQHNQLTWSTLKKTRRTKELNGHNQHTKLISLRIRSTTPVALVTDYGFACITVFRLANNAILPRGRCINITNKWSAKRTVTLGDPGSRE